MCLVLQDEEKLPSNIAKLYEKGIKLLLSRWNKEKQIDNWEVGIETYRKLKTEDKEALLLKIAGRKFENPKNFVLFEQEELANQITQDLQLADLSEGVEVLKAIEAQHGLLIERADELWSFSHLTFQEHFTVQWLTQLSSKELAEKIENQHWQAVVKQLVKSQQPANRLIKLIKQAIEQSIAQELKVQNFLDWLFQKSNSIQANYKPQVIRAFYYVLFLNLDPALDRVDRVWDYDLKHLLEPVCNGNSVIHPDSVLNSLLEPFRTLRDSCLESLRMLKRMRNRILNPLQDLDLDLDLAFNRALNHAHEPNLECTFDLACARAREFNDIHARDSILPIVPFLAFLGLVAFLYLVHLAHPLAHPVILTYFGFGFLSFILVFALALALNNVFFASLALIPIAPIFIFVLAFIALLPLLILALAPMFVHKYSDQTRKLQQLKKALPSSDRTKWVEQLREVMIEHRNIGHDWQFTDEEKQQLERYYNANKFLVDLIKVEGAVSEDFRTKIEDTLLLPWTELQRRSPEVY